MSAASSRSAASRSLTATRATTSAGGRLRFRASLADDAAAPAESVLGGRTLWRPSASGRAGPAPFSLRPAPHLAWGFAPGGGGAVPGGAGAPRPPHAGTRVGVAPRPPRGPRSPRAPAPAPPAAGARPCHAGPRARAGTRRSPRDARRPGSAPPGRGPRRDRPTACRASRRKSWQESLQLLLQVRPRSMQARAHRPELQLQHLRDLLVGEALDVAQYHHDTPVLRELGDRAPERRLQLATLERPVRARARVGQPQQRVLTVAREPPLPGGEPVQATAP